MKKLVTFLLLSVSTLFSMAMANSGIEPIVFQDRTQYIVSLPYQCPSDEYVEVKVSENNVLEAKCAPKICALAEDSKGVYSVIFNKMRLGLFVVEGVKTIHIKDFKGTSKALEIEMKKILEAKTCKRFVGYTF